jgi:cytochrome c-type biogenesis protein CcsB
MESLSLFAAYIFIGVALLVSIISLWSPKSKADFVSALLLAGADVTIVIALIIRGVTNDRVPLSSLYEFLLWFVIGLITAFLLLRIKMKAPGFTLIVGLVAFCVMSYTGLLSPEAIPLMPALKSKWLVVHVATAIVSYGCFGIAAGLAVLYLIKEKSDKPDAQGLIPGIQAIDRYIFQLNEVGFAFQTLLLISGAVWAEEAWGSWWSWDPKETWALITWLIYAAYQHGFHAWNWRGRKSAIISIVGFAVVLFTLIGVTYLLGGLHSYA